MIILINKLINLGKVLIIPLAIILIIPLFLAILNMFGVRTYDVVLLIIMIVTSLITGFLSGRKTEKNGYLNGIILGVILSLIMFILSLIFKNKYQIDTLIYYLIIIASSTIGSMIGIQKNSKQKQS